MTPREALREGVRILAASRDGSGSPLLDASLLLASALDLSKEGLYAAAEAPLEAPRLEAYRRLLARRGEGVPVAYLVGRKEFFGRDFLVDPRVLVPRPDTETLVEAALAEGDAILAARAAEGLPPRPLRVHEPCTGSGAVALSLALERPAWEVSASDLSSEALELARRNADRLVDPSRPGGPLSLHASDLLAWAPGPWDLVVANPPYVPSLEAAALLGKGWSEPLMALDGGEDGLVLVRRLVAEAAVRLARGGALLVEADPDEAEELRGLLAAAGFVGVSVIDDLAGAARVTRGRLP